MKTRTKKLFDKTFFIIAFSYLAFFYIYLFVVSRHIVDALLIWDWDTMIRYGLNYNYVKFDLERCFLYLAPIYSGVAAILCLNRRKNIGPFQACRVKDYKKILVMDILHVSLKVALACYSALLIIFFLSWLAGYDPSQNEMLQAAGEDASKAYAYIFIDVFGSDFYFKQPQFYDLSVYTVQYFYGPFLYGILGASFSLLFEKKYQVFLITTLYYYSVTLFINRLAHSGFVSYNVGRIMRHFEPGRVAMPNSLGDVSTPLFFLASLVAPLVPSAIILYRQIHKVKERI